MMCCYKSLPNRGRSAAGPKENRDRSAKGAKEGSQGQAKRRPWLQTQEAWRALKVREDTFDGNMVGSISAFQGSLLKYLHYQGPRAPRLPLATFFRPLPRAS